MKGWAEFMKKLFFALCCFFSAFVYIQGSVFADEPYEYDLKLLREGAFPQTDLTYIESDTAAAIRDSLYNRDDSIAVNDPDISRDELAKLYEEVINQTPELYYAAGHVSVSCPDEHSFIIYPSYNEELSIAFEYGSQQSYKQAKKDILAQVQPGMSDVEKLLAVHDYILLHYEYDLTYSIYSAKEFFINHNGVCQAYADAFTEIMGELGIRCYTISSDSMNHAWNKVYVNGNWYHIDVTWDDPVTDTYGQAYHHHFLVSDKCMEERREHYGWNKNQMPANDTTYDDFFWTGINSPISYYNGELYWASSWGSSTETGSYDAGVNKYDLSNDTYTNLINTYSLSNCDIYNGYLYAIADEHVIYMMPIDRISDAVKIADIGEFDDLNGIYIEDGIVKYARASEKYYKINDNLEPLYNDYYKYRSFYSFSVRNRRYEDYHAEWSYDDETLYVSYETEPDYSIFPAPWAEYTNEITAVVFDDKITKIGDCMFRDHTALRSVKFPSKLRSIGKEAFYNTRLGVVELPFGLKSVGRSAFSSGTRVVFMHNRIQDIGEYAFYGASAIYYDGSEEELAGVDIDDPYNYFTSRIICNYKEPLHKFIYNDGDNAPVILWVRNDKALVGDRFDVELTKYNSYYVSGCYDASISSDSPCISASYNGTLTAASAGSANITVTYSGITHTIRLHAASPATARVSNTGNSPEAGCYIAASYTSDGTLGGVSYINTVLDANSSEEIEYNDYGGNVRILKWDSLDSMIPLE